MDQKQTGNSYKHIYIILNPIAGNSKVENLQPALEEHLGEAGLSYEIYETTGKENVAEVARRACEHGADLVVAAGGDGTVSGVVDGLVGQDVPLGIIPVGTGNGLARAMSIPLDPEEAMRLLTGAHTIFPIDALQVDDHYYVLNVSAGISSRAMRETSPEEKRSKGMLAYAQTILKDLTQAESSVFDLDLDGHTVRVRAAEVLVANGTVLQEAPVLFGPRENYQDGRLEVNILTATETADYVRLARDLLLGSPEDATDLHDFTVKEHIRIDVDGSPIPVQADGELIGHTPVEVRLAPGALKIVVPEKDAA